MIQRFKVGNRVTVSDGAGLASRKTATVIAPYDWHRATDGTYRYPGKNQVPLRYDDGTMGFMYKAYLSKGVKV